MSLALLALYLIILMCGSEAARGQCKPSEKSANGKALKGHTFKEVAVKAIIECQNLCESDQRCFSYNYYLPGMVCEMNSETKETKPYDFVTDDQRFYMKREDDDECMASPSVCGANAECKNTIGSYICSCKEGFSGDGKTCADIDECAEGSHDCLPSFASCINTAGSYNCTCNQSYVGDGKASCRPEAIFGYFDWKPGRSCLEIKTIEGERAVTGRYWLNEAGVLFQTYCHMESAAQVWTLIARFSNDKVKNWMDDSGDWWYYKNVADGETADPSNNTDMISPAFWLTSGNELKITRSDDSQHTALLQTTGDCLGGQTFRSKITSYGDFRNGNTWRFDRRCLGNCTVQYGGQYETTKGFNRAKCNGTILSADKIGFWCDRGTWDGSVMMIGGSGTGGCGNTYHGVGITSAKVPSFFVKDRPEQDFGDSPWTAGLTKVYSLNIWIR